VGLLDASQRRKLNECMLDDVLRAVKRCEKVNHLIIVSPDEAVLKLAREQSAYPIRESYESGVNAAVSLATRHCLRNKTDLVVILPSDVPLVKPEDVDLMIELASISPTVIISPSYRFDGTNALALRPPRIIKTFYDKNSFHSHLDAAKNVNARSLIYLSERLMLDIDTNDDISELLNRNSNTRTAEFLKEILKKKYLSSKRFDR
ncbi:MAG: 2-phospho-L-lactate guanylyltransferase, partial [Candidatus Bathyarchaeia archaeon]